MYREELFKIIESSYIEPKEIAPAFRARILMCSILKKNVYIYGAGKDVDIFIRYLLDENVKIIAIIDRDNSKNGNIIEGIPIIDVSSINNENPNEYENSFVFIYSKINRDTYEEKRVLRFLNKFEDYMFLGDYRYDIAGFLPQHAIHYENRRLFYKSHKEELADTLESLFDEESKKTFVEYIRTFVCASTFRGREIPTKYKYFFDYDKLPIYKHLEEEIWINMGADIGGTLAEYYQNGLRGKKILAVEGNKSILSELEENVKRFPHDFANHVKIVPCFVDGSGNVAKSIEECGDKVTLINADIEGMELLMLKEFSKIIKNNRPVIAICAYHKNDDLITLISYIKSLVMDYRFVLRKYVGWLRGDTRRGLELVLYAVPIERYLLN